tara:strand:- start:293 stop:487 length:195 start_codon:yes stop_codon:yes gene_type:complete
MAKPFKSRKEIAKGFQKKPPRVFKKQDKIASFIRAIQGELPPFKKRKNGGAVMKARGGTFKGTF